MKPKYIQALKRLTQEWLKVVLIDYVKSLKGRFRAWQEFGLPTTNSLEAEVK